MNIGGVELHRLLKKQSSDISVATLHFTIDLPPGPPLDGQSLYVGA